MANIDLTSFVNTSTVPDIELVTIGVAVSSVINSSIVSDIAGSSIATSVSSATNTSSVSSVGIRLGTFVSSVVNTSLISPISRLPDSIGLSEFTNQSIIPSIYVADLGSAIAVQLSSIPSTSNVPNVIVYGQEITTTTITPITRPNAPISSATTGLKKFVFRDLAMKGGAHPLTGDILTVTDVHAVGQAIKNIVMTAPTERFFDQIDFGVGVEKYLFKLHDAGLKGRIKDEITAQVGFYEPRALILDIVVSGEAHLNQLEIDIKYQIRTTQVTNTITILLERR